MAKFIILFFLTTGGAVMYSTYHGINQESIETLKKETVRSNSYHGGSSGSYGGSSSYGGSTGSYNSGGYSYGK